MLSWFGRRPAAPSPEQLRVLDALAGYPPYAPPVWKSYDQSDVSANEDYVAYFFNQQDRRIEALRSFLGKLQVVLGFEDQKIKTVSAWCASHADLLVDGLQHQESEALWTAYNHFNTPWVESLVGLNVVFDLGVFMGSCIIARNPKLKWLPCVALEPMSVASHFIHGQKGGRVFDPIKWTYTECKNVHSARFNAERWHEDRLYGTIDALGSLRRT
ncbi:hypothetical protein ACQR16_29230 [Bradyrhizobium oligotrophicum]|uniref:hypothetical protein n=1 Tax=Bradyrhizobium oligotrophicum TaxID=44255 RepID=UPI003EB72316